LPNNTAWSAALLTIILAATQASAADPKNGERLARRWCAECHVVAQDQTRASADVASFRSLAQRPGFDAGKLAFFLLAPHPKMPGMALTRNEAGDIAAYVATLGRK